MCHSLPPAECGREYLGAYDVSEEHFGFGVRKIELGSCLCPNPESHGLTLLPVSVPLCAQGN